MLSSMRTSSSRCVGFMVAEVNKGLKDFAGELDLPKGSENRGWDPHSGLSPLYFNDEVSRLYLPKRKNI